MHVHHDRSPHLLEVGRSPLSRRAVLLGGAAAAVGFLTPGVAAAAEDAPRARPRPVSLGFTAIEASADDVVRVPPGYTARPFIPWGTPILGDHPEFRPGQNTPAEQAQQTGMHHDGMHFFPIPNGKDDSGHGLLVVNHEYTDEARLQTGTTTLPPKALWTAEMVARSQAAVGVSVVEIERSGAEWRVVRSRLNRRVTATTPMEFTGPARGHRLLRTAADAAGRTPLGTINNCSNGATPWGTYLTCEENFNQFFRVDDAAGVDAENAALLARYTVGGDTYNWATHDPRFAVDPAHPHEPNRFGWVVEIDPFSPESTPRKRTALGRFKHEGAFVQESRGGRAVVYMGDDQANEFVYKFVSAAPWRRAIARGRSPLDDGTLYVARFDENGAGRWLPLEYGRGPLTAANGFADQGDVLVKTRLAATLVGATPMDRPEWTTVDPRTGTVFVTLTNNTEPTKVANAANPRTPNKWGHIVGWKEDGGDHAATRFSWHLLLLAGQGPAAADGSTVAAEDAFGSPDGLWSDPDGRLWIETDGTQPGGANNQMFAAVPGPAGGPPEIRRFLTGPKGCELTGITATPDQRTLFVNIQHPGEGMSSTWPAGDPGGGVQAAVARSATLIITKDDGGVIGT